MYLTTELKEYYFDDFKNVLLITTGYQRVSDSVRKQLITINDSPFIQTLYYSKYETLDGNFSIGGCSFLEIAFFSQLQRQLEILLESLKAKFNTKDEFLYILSGPSDNPLYTRPPKFDIGCYTNPDYFRITRFRISIESSDQTVHNFFFDTLAAGLTSLSCGQQGLTNTAGCF